MPVDLPVLFSYRLAVTRIGERDLFHWWESNALSEEGRYALGRLFRQTSTWVAIELALESAWFRHNALVPPGAPITLFNLGPEIEDAFTSWLRRAKVDDRLDAVKLPIVPEESRATVADAFRALGVAIEETKPKEIGDRAIHVGQIGPDELRTDALRIVRMLLGAYVASSKGKFLAPYATLKSSQS